MPWAIEQDMQCAYVKEHVSICGENAGLIPYLEIHYCWLNNQCVSQLYLHAWNCRGVDRRTLLTNFVHKPAPSTGFDPLSCITTLALDRTWSSHHSLLRFMRQ